MASPLHRYRGRARGRAAPRFQWTGIWVAAMVQVDGGKGVVGGEYVGDAVSMLRLHSGERSQIVAPRAGVGGAGMSSRIACLIGPLCHFASGFWVQRHTHHCGRSISGQAPRQLRQVALMRCRLGHGNTLGRNRGRCFEPDRGSRRLSSRPIWSAARLQHQNTISSSSSSRSGFCGSSTSSRSAGAADAFGGGAAAAAPFPDGCRLRRRGRSRLLRRRDTHPQRRHQLAAEVDRGWINRDDLADPAVDDVAERFTQSADVGAIENSSRSSLVNQRTSRCSLSSPIPTTSSVGLLILNFFSLSRSAAFRYFDLSKFDASNTHDGAS